MYVVDHYQNFELNSNKKFHVSLEDDKSGQQDVQQMVEHIDSYEILYLSFFIYKYRKRKKIIFLNFQNH